MAWNFGDSFDLYATTADMAFGYWDSSSGGSLQPGRFTNSRAWGLGAANFAVKAATSNDATHHFVFSFQPISPVTGAGQGLYFTLFDGATAQCTVMFTSGGSIQILSGNTAGAVLATYASAFTLQNTWYAFEIEVVVNGATGAMRVRKNGNTSTDYDSGPINTRAGTANNYANKLQVGCVTNSANSNLDDLLWRSDPSVAWMGDIRCYARMPATDVQAQFSHTTTQWPYLVWGTTGISNAYSANQAAYMRFVSLANGSVAGFAFSSASGSGGTGHVKAALFADNGGTIGAVMATSSEITNPGAATITCLFPTPGHITAGVAYWIGIIQDASLNYAVINQSSVAPPAGAVTAAINLTSTPYASWPVSNPGGTPSAFNIPGSGTLVMVPTQNADAVSDVQQDALTTYVYDNNPGDADFYTVGPIPSTPAVVFATVIRGFMTKSDAGSRTANVQLRSGGATVATPTITLTTSSWLWAWRVDTLDPATGAAWTPAAVNAVQIGPKVVT